MAVASLRKALESLVISFQNNTAGCMTLLGGQSATLHVVANAQLLRHRSHMEGSRTTVAMTCRPPRCAHGRVCFLIGSLKEIATVWLQAYTAVYSCRLPARQLSSPFETIDRTRRGIFLMPQKSEALHGQTLTILREYQACYRAYHGRVCQ